VTASGQVVVLRVWRVRRMLPAMLRVATSRARLRRGGPAFVKVLGTGSGETFGPRDADLHHGALLRVHADAAEAEAFAGHAVVRGWDDAARERLVVTMRPQHSRGRWSGCEPFVAGGGRHDGPVAAVTRARLRPSRAVRFWRAVPDVSADLHDRDGLRLAIGVGEAPLGWQGTVSLWRDAAALRDFAVTGAAHARVVEQTPGERWYAEELFARFAVVGVEGSYRGRQP
jgi:hypothetical protein